MALNMKMKKKIHVNFQNLILLLKKYILYTISHIQDNLENSPIVHLSICRSIFSVQSVMILIIDNTAGTYICITHLLYLRYNI